MRLAVVLLASAAGICCAAPVKLVAHQPVRTAGYPDVSTMRFDAPKLSGTIAALTSKPGFGGAVEWTLTLDAAGTPHAYVFSLPPQIVPVLAKGKTVTVEGRVVGGGPNARGQLAISDAGGPLVAISMLPAGWTIETGAQVKVDKDKSYDETNFAVLLHAPGATDAAELVVDWRSFAFAGHRYAANGTTVSRELHAKPPPPDYVGGWTDFAVVRTDP